MGGAGPVRRWSGPRGTAGPSKDAGVAAHFCRTSYSSSRAVLPATSTSCGWGGNAFNHFGRQAGDASQADRELPGGMTGGNVNGGGGVERNVERVMTKIKFESVFAPAMEGHGQRSIILRVDGEEVWEGHIGQGEIVNINVTLPIQTLSVELGTRRFDEHGNPDGFLNYKHLVEIPHPSEEDVWKVTLFDDNMTRALFRSRIDGLGGKFELEVSFHG